MRVWWEEQFYAKKGAEIQEDVLLVAKQFMVFAHIRCPKPPLNKYARGLLQSTIRMENISYLGMEQVICYCGNEKAYYMPYTNERWISPRWKGKANPNEHWWDEAIYDVCDVSVENGASMKGVHANG